MFTWLHLFTGYSLKSHVDLSVLSTLITECFLFYFLIGSPSLISSSAPFSFFFFLPLPQHPLSIPFIVFFLLSFFTYYTTRSFLSPLSLQHTHTTLSHSFFSVTHKISVTLSQSLSPSVIHLSIYRLLSSTNEFSRFPITAMNASLMQLAVCHHGLILSAMRSVICPSFVNRFVLHN